MLLRRNDEGDGILPYSSPSLFCSQAVVFFPSSWGQSPQTPDARYARGLREERVGFVGINKLMDGTFTAAVQ